MFSSYKADTYYSDRVVSEFSSGADIFKMIHEGNLEAARYQLQHGGTWIERRDIEDRTLLICALTYRQKEIAKLLIKMGANLDASDKYDNTPRKFILDNHSTFGDLLLISHDTNTDSELLGQESPCHCVIS